MSSSFTFDIGITGSNYRYFYKIFYFFLYWCDSIETWVVSSIRFSSTVLVHNRSWVLETAAPALTCSESVTPSVDRQKIFQFVSQFVWVVKVGPICGCFCVKACF